MNNINIFYWISFALTCAAYPMYIWALSQKGTRPNVASWLSWLLLDVVILLAMWSSGENILQMSAYTVGTLFVVWAVIRMNPEMKFSLVDVTCLGLVAFAITIWFFFGNPELAIFLGLVGVTVGTIPMWVGLHKEPSNESLYPWGLIVMGGICAVLGIETWSFAEAAMPVWFLLLQIVSVMLMLRGGSRKVIA